MTESKAEILSFPNRVQWREWLDLHHANSTSICLQIAKINSPHKTITYQEALDEALCFGWIDGQKLPYNEHFWLQKFSKRKPKSIWSKTNIQHVERLTKERKMKPSGLRAVQEAKDDGRWEQAYDAQSQMTIPQDFLLELSKNKPAELFFKSLNRTNLFAIYFKLHSAKKPETRKKRLDQIIEKLSKRRKISLKKSTLSRFETLTALSKNTAFYVSYPPIN